MPLYEYECLKCGTRFEEIRKFSDPPLSKHVGCGGKVRKLLSAPAIQFKGTGWYITDYARAGKTDPDKKAAKSESDKKAGKSDSDGKADKKAAASESKTSGESKAAAAESTKAATTEASKT
jgi:putative FmdB family regulatory protein